MSTVLLRRRAVAGAAGAPAALMSGEPAYNMADKTVYIGYGDDGSGNATSVLPIAGEGAVVMLTLNQTVDGTKTFTSSPIVPTLAASDNTTKAANAAFVQSAISAAVSSASITDGDKGDIAVTGSGSIWTVDNGAISNAKLASMANLTFKGRVSAGTGVPEDLTVAQMKTALNLAGTNSGDQTITLTGDVGGSGTGSFATTIAAGAVSYAKMQTVAAATLIGSISGSTAAPGAVTVGASLSLSAGVLSRAALTGDVTAAANSNATTIAAGVVSNAKLANVATGTFKGRATVGTGSPEDLTAAQAKTLLALGKSDVGLGNVDNTSDAAKPISTATQAALDLKAPLASPTFTGVVTIPTPTAGDNSTKAASTAFVQAVVAALVNAAPGTLDQLNEIATALGNDPNFAATMTTALAGKLVKASNLSDLTNVATARTNLGLGSMATQNANAVAITGGTIDGVTIDGGTF